MDNAATLVFLTTLPDTITLEDYAGAEKIRYLPQELPSEGYSYSHALKVDNLTLYEPWDNKAIFYGYVIGTSGLNLLSDMDREFIYIVD